MSKRDQLNYIDMIKTIKNNKVIDFEKRRFERILKS